MFIPATSTFGASAWPLPTPQAVLAAQGRLVFTRARLSNLLGVPLALMVTMLLWPYQSHAVLVGWVAAKLAVTAWRLVLDRRHRDASDAQVCRCLRYSLPAQVADGLVIGALGTWLLPSHGTPAASLMLATVAAVASVGFVVLATHFGSLLAFVLPLLAPMVVFQLWQGDRLGLFAGLAGLLFLAVLVLEGWRAAQLVRHGIRTRLSLDALVAEREAALELAQRHSQVKARFLATMSHEMRTPLHGMLGIARLMHHPVDSMAAAGLPGAQDMRQQLHTLVGTGEHLLTLISDMLDFSQLETGQLKHAPQPFDLAALMAEVGQRTRQACDDKGLAMVLRVDLPSPSWVNGDPRRLRQVLGFLTGNAVKFTDTGRISVTVRRERDGHSVFEVQDTGPGIPAKLQAHVFDAFHQGDGSQMRRHGGTGLGLALSRSLAQLMGGDLACHSTPGQGTRFVLQLPLAGAAAPAPPAAPRDTPRQLQGQVLLVEDNPVNALVAQTMLSRAGLSVALAGDGAQALEQLAARPFDLVLMDCQMPVLDGISATRRIRQDERRHDRRPMPIIGLTANASDGDRENCLAAGMTDYLAKPFREQDLHDVVALHLKKTATADADLWQNPG